MGKREINDKRFYHRLKADTLQKKNKKKKNINLFLNISLLISSTDIYTFINQD